MRRLIHFSGAGISAESGVQTFRGPNGLWEGEDPKVIADYDTWKANFDRVHAFFNGRRMQLAKVEPNAAHFALAEWATRMPVVTFTQNIDDLFERAGLPDVCHLHGKLTEMRCEACGTEWDIGYRAFSAGTEQCQNHKCASKKGIKPNVIFFGERAPLYQNLYSTLESLTEDDIILVVGTSSRVIDIDSLLDRKPGFKVLVDTTARCQDPDIYNVTLTMTSGEALPALEELLAAN